LQQHGQEDTPHSADMLPNAFGLLERSGRGAYMLPVQKIGFLSAPILRFSGAYLLGCQGASLECTSLSLGYFAAVTEPAVGDHGLFGKG
jgi:hypothetical protein